MLTIDNSQRYKEEIQDFQSKISKIVIQKNKKHAQELLQDLQDQVAIINEGHAPNNDGNIDPHTLRQHVLNLTDIRTKLTSFLQGA
tara:strand:+ start:18170 stop:18427 length:258 start_codon:yes stop_codon:yes gene_type:complete